MASSRQAPAAEQPRDGEIDPVYEWLDDGGSYLLRLSLPGFKKEDFRVHVDAAGRLTVIGQGRVPRLHKAFQLPNTANLDDITGRFDGAVLTLTVPKLRQPTKEEQAAAGEPKDPQEDKTAAAPKVGHAEAETEMDRRIEAERASMSVRSKDEEEKDKRKAESAPPRLGEKANGARRVQYEKASADHRAYVAREAAPRIEAVRAKVAEAKAAAERTSMSVRGKDEDEKDKRRAEPAPPLPGEKANGARWDQDEKASADHRAYVAREAARRIEAARAKVAEAKAVAERTGEQWKERAAAEGFKWAETIGQKKELIATAVAAFTLGVFVSQALGRR